MSELTPPANRAVATEHQRQKFSRRKTILSTGFGVVVSLLVASAALSYWHAAPGTSNGVLLAITGAAVLGGLWLWRATLREMSRQEQFTEQLQTAETALQGSEARLGSILGSATEAILCVDERQRIVLFNAAAEAVFGRTSEDMLGQKVDVLIPGRFRTEHVSHIRRFGETGVTRRRMGEFGHLSGVRANGEEFPIEASISQSTAGGQRYFTVILRDITERKRAEEALQQSEELFSKAFRNNPLAVKFTTETEGREIDVNDAFLEMTGYKREDVIGKTSTEIGFWVAPAERLKVVQEVRRTGRVVGFPFRFKKANGEEREGVLSAESVEVGGQRCMLTTVQDVTESKQLEEQFRQSQKMEAVGRLAGGIAHDFNNLLGVIIGSCEIAGAALGPSHPAERHLEVVESSAQQAAILTRQLLAFSRQQVNHPKVVQLNDTVNHVSKMLFRVIGEDVELVLRPGAELHAVRADEGQIEQVLMNLVVNARDAMPKGGKIVLETRNAELDETYNRNHPAVKPGPYVLLSVTDNGCGMDESTRSRIFEPFFTTKEVGKGTGLGLSTVYGIVKQSAGYIWVYSEPQKGTSFKIYLPAVPRAEDANGIAEEKHPAAGGWETVLLVEDEKMLRDITATLLRSGGYRVLEAADPETAMELAAGHEGPIHLLLTDVVMPGISGPELAGRVLGSRTEAKLLYMSGYTGDLLAIHGVDGSGLSLIEKPFTREALLTRVRQVLDS